METTRIAAFPAFADVPEAELDALASALREVEVGEGDKIVTVDAYGDTLYFVEDGEAEVRAEDGEARTLARGDAFGEIGLLLTGQRTATVVAGTPMRLLSLSGQDFESIRERVPEAERSLRRLGLCRA